MLPVAESDVRFLNGLGSVGTFGGPVTVNVSNTDIATAVTMGVNGTSNYNGDIVVTNTGGANGVYFNSGSSASSILAATRTISLGAAGFNDGVLSR